MAAIITAAHAELKCSKTLTAV